MKIQVCMMLAAVFAAGLLLSGCGDQDGAPGAGVDETKPVAEVKAEAQKMDVEQLKAVAVKYRDAIQAKKPELEKLAAKIKDIPLTEALGEEAKALKADMEKLNASIKALTERLQVYVEQLKEKGADTSELTV